NDEKIKRALKANVRLSIDDNLEIGDRVYYKRNNEDRWKGPGEISGMIGKQIRIEHEGSSVQVHSTRLQKAPDEKVSDTNEILTGEYSNPNATSSQNNGVQSNMSDNTPEDVDGVPLQTLDGYPRKIMSLDGNPKEMGSDPRKGKLDSNPNAMNCEPLQTLGGDPRQRMQLDGN
ncbi:unnamed protein product, partial [Meganyctiphanes norvegica]